jgi:alkylhydroperoxidase family enzyme
MARVTYVEPRNAPAQVKEVYDRVLKGKPGNIQKALAHRPEILQTFLPFYGSIGKSLPPRLYEMLYIRVSMVNGCEY